MKFNFKLVTLVSALLLAGGSAYAESGMGSAEHNQDSTGMTTETTREPASQAEGTQKRDKNKPGKSAKSAELKQGRDYQVIEFQQGSTELSENSKKMIRETVDKAKQAGEIEKLHVAVWSDKAFPAAEGAELSEADRNLAEQRSEVLENFIENELQVSDVETYSMAEGSNWFARAFNTEEAELRSLFSQQGAPSTVDPQEFRIVKEKGAPSKAVLLFEPKKKDQSASKASGSREPAASEAEGSRDPASVERGATQPTIGEDVRVNEDAPASDTSDK